MRRAARFGDGWLPYMFTPEQLAESIATVRRFAARYGRQAEDIDAGLFIFSAVYRSGDEARRVAAERLSQNYRQDFSRLIDRYALFGTPQDCRRRLGEFVEAGARLILFAWACRPEDLAENTRLMATEVVPAFR
jgi:alkanesulfonate monooxygenase SsuD/methylene tetrahydromethanopterin reductase-like flavin-dependent oxidoreductase (luciferase family)